MLPLPGGHWKGTGGRVEGHPAARTGSSEDSLRAWRPRAKVRQGRMQLQLSAPSGLSSRPAVGWPQGGHELREEPSPGHRHEDTARWGCPDPGQRQSELAGRENHKGHRGPPRPPALSLAPWTAPQRCVTSGEVAGRATGVPTEGSRGRPQRGGASPAHTLTVGSRLQAVGTAFCCCSHHPACRVL